MNNVDADSPSDGESTDYDGFDNSNPPSRTETFSEMVSNNYIAISNIILNRVNHHKKYGKASHHVLLLERLFSSSWYLP